MDENRRRRSRVTTHFKATFTRPGAEPVPLVTQNISLKGLLAEPASQIKGHDLGQVRIALASDALIAIECRVIRSDRTGVAIDFLPMDEESFFHLRNLVRYNAPDADQIDSELKTPAFED
ncbi:MAG: PilZ domain-containing protein [Humidesulfovibrio sp.]|nr:PilZ domain-containing protein [Desulfovibrio sp.]MDO9084121.1 PilZ domain-containing protein [Humidesulfovibrio sp.]